MKFFEFLLVCTVLVLAVEDTSAWRRRKFGRRIRRQRVAKFGERDPEIVCRLQADEGVCYERHSKWYYDVNEMQCKPFEYKGCGGNYNNFFNRNACEFFCQNVKNEQLEEPEDPVPEVTDGCDPGEAGALDLADDAPIMDDGGDMMDDGGMLEEGGEESMLDVEGMGDEGGMITEEGGGIMTDEGEFETDIISPDELEDDAPLDDMPLATDVDELGDDPLLTSSCSGIFRRRSRRCRRHRRLRRHRLRHRRRRQHRHRFFRHF